MKPETQIEQAIIDNNIGMYDICKDSIDNFEYWIAGPYMGGKVPIGLDLCTFPEGNWAKFTTKGPLPKSLQTLNTYIWDEWMKKEGLKHGAYGNVTIEVYSNGDSSSNDYECGIWVPVKEL